MVYNIFDNLFKTVNTYSIVERIFFIIKYNKKLKKEILYEIWLWYNKSESFKIKKYQIRQISTIKNEYFYEIITIYYSK